MIYEEDPRYAKSRLEDTVVRLLDGTPIYINRILIPEDMEMYARVRRIPDPDEEDFDEYDDVDDDEDEEGGEEGGQGGVVVHYTNLVSGAILVTTLDQLDISPVPLGYVNIPNNSYYVTRRPIRGYWKQGLGGGNIWYKNRLDVDYNYRNLVPTIQGVYPTFREALEEVRGEAVRKAFSRQWCLKKEGKSPPALEYRGEKVGTYDGNINLIAKKAYLIEDLTEAVGNGY